MCSHWTCNKMTNQGLPFGSEVWVVSFLKHNGANCLTIDHGGQMNNCGLSPAGKSFINLNKTVTKRPEARITRFEPFLTFYAEPPLTVSTYSTRLGRTRPSMFYRVTGVAVLAKMPRCPSPRPLLPAFPDQPADVVSQPQGLCPVRHSQNNSLGRHQD